MSAQPVTLGELVARHARYIPTGTALIDDRRSLSFREVDQESGAFADALFEAGVRAGDRIGVLAANTAAQVLVIVALSKLGATFVPVAVRSTPEAALEQLTQVDARMFLADRGLMESMEIASGAPPIMTFDDDREGSLDAAVRTAPPRPADLPAVSPDAIASLMFTSGTTGRRKAVMLSHANHLSNTIGVCVSRNYRTDDRFLMYASPAFMAGLAGCLYPMMYLGATTVTTARTATPELVRTMARHRVTSTLGFQPTLVDLAALDQDELIEDLASLSRVYSGSPWHMQADLRARIEAMLARLEVEWYWNYGLTEAGSSVCTFTPYDEARGTEEALTTGMGRPCAGVDVRILDDQGADAALGEIGEIAVASGAVMRGYLGNEEKTAEALRDGWLHTGDLGRQGEDGVFYFVDRKKDIIKSGGMTVAPGEIEQGLRRHPGIAEVIAVGVPHERWGEAVVAVAVPISPDLTEESVLEFAKSALAAHAVPKAAVLVEAIGSSSGNEAKISRAEVQAVAAKELSGRPGFLVEG